ncbi:tyrosine-type recombinase/integrase [Dyadobacter sp. NIV53]|uniref:tyrosine-type recombinase/integrase n=1 Tax=Dyadobacter sp. NIV53 TaxID=2861765 RepID=UPI001C87357A|nr:tyrosine-type recombinase/integrase [Dyadobacter sp. NIV53]
MNSNNLESFSGTIANFVSFLEKNRYSYSTIKAYKKAVCSFFVSTGASPSTVGESDLKAYIEEKQSENISEGFLRQMVSAIKLLFSGVFKRDLETEHLYQPQREYKVPEVLTKKEINRILEATDNLKHRAILTGLYSGGLRLSEITGLEISDIDFKNMLIVIRSDFGLKEREVMLSIRFRDILLQYLKMYMPKKWLFEGNQSAKPYSNRSVQQVFANAITRAGIEKKVSVHTLRHSFATHLLESGTDIHIIQDFLGHSSIKTTKVYQQIAKADKHKILSPMDMI